MEILLVYMVLITILTIIVKFEPRFDKVNGRWGVWHTTCKYNRRQREFNFLDEIFKR